VLDDARFRLPFDLDESKLIVYSGSVSWSRDFVDHYRDCDARFVIGHAPPWTWQRL
jgi:hypothetical protein